MNETRLVTLERRAHALGDCSIHLIPETGIAGNRQWFGMITLFHPDSLGELCAVHMAEAVAPSLDEAFSRVLDAVEAWARENTPPT